MKAFAILALSAATPALAADPVTGSWMTDGKDGIIEIAPCGQKLCGRLVKMLAPPKGPAVDRNNPDAALRTRPLLGLAVLNGFVAEGNAWRGQAYDPKAGKSYNTTLQRTGPDTLKVRGCLVAFLCRTVSWTRVR